MMCWCCDHFKVKYVCITAMLLTLLFDSYTKAIGQADTKHSHWRLLTISLHQEPGQLAVTIETTTH